MRPQTSSPRTRGRLSPNSLGSLYMVIGSLGYVVNDGLIRAATDQGLDVFQALFLRGLTMTVILAGFMAATGQAFARSQLGGPLVVRVGAELGASALFFAGLVQLEFANAQTILMLVPFAVTVAAAALLHEPVTARHYLAVILGFAGVIAVMRPLPGQFSAWSIVVAVSALFLVVRELATRRIDRSVSPLPIAALTAFALTVLTGMISVLTGWGPINRTALVQLGVACICLIVGYFFTIQTVRVGDLSVSAPFRYSTLVGAVLIGVIAFDETPDALTPVGCGLIIGAGVYTTQLDRRGRRYETAVRA